MTAVAQTNGRAPRVIAPAAEPHAPAGSALQAAILAVQAQAPKLARNADGQAGPRVYRYVTLDAIVDAVLPLLVEHELVWTTWPSATPDGAPALRYRISHVPSGEFQEDTVPLCAAKADPQGVGSAITYMRRYALTAVLNLTTGEDDDGAAASAPPATSQVASQPSAAPAQPSERPATAKQRGLIEARAREAELTAAELANAIKRAAGAQTEIWKPGAAERWTVRALDRLPARLVDAVLEQIKATAGEES